MSATVIDPVDEMRKFEPVSDAVVLAAIDRAERHRGGAGEGARMSNLAEHLGFVHGAWTTHGLRPQLDALIDARADTDDERPPWYRPSRRSTRGWGCSTGPGAEGEA
jgi:hypothetical protein